MTANRCEHESELWDALSSGRWPEACGRELRDHVEACHDCRELALVSAALGADRREGEAAANVPPPGAVWWRMQMRMERDAKQIAAKTVRRAHSAIVAATIGALVMVLSMTPLLRNGWAWLVSAFPSTETFATIMPLTAPITVVLLAALALAVLTPVALYLAVTEE